MEQERHRPLRGRVILITGASRGIGAAAAKRLAQRGGAVVINYHRNRDRAMAVLEEVEKEGGRGMVFQADVTQTKQVEEMRRAVREKFSSGRAGAFRPLQLHSRVCPWNDRKEKGKDHRG
jgi:3-oxoacyl-[acyl-carrier protein] reductase